MSTTDQQLTQDKAVDDAYYQAAVRGELTTFGQYVHPDLLPHPITSPGVARTLAPPGSATTC